MRTRKFALGNQELTITEMRVLILELYCDVRKEVAPIMNCKPSTVESHIKNIYAKLRIKGTKHLCRFAAENGLYCKGYYNGEYLFAGFSNLPWKRIVNVPVAVGV